MSSARTLGLALGLLALTIIVYWPVRQAGFIWDDDDHLTENPAMTSPDGLVKIWSSLSVSRYFPLTLTTFWVQRQLWSLNPLPYHAVNVVLHGLNAILIYLTLRRGNLLWIALFRLPRWRVDVPLARVSSRRVTWPQVGRRGGALVCRLGGAFFDGLICGLDVGCRFLGGALTRSSTL